MEEVKITMMIILATIKKEGGRKFLFHSKGKVSDFIS